MTITQSQLCFIQKQLETCSVLGIANYHSTSNLFVATVFAEAKSNKRVKYGYQLELRIKRNCSGFCPLTW